MIKKICVVCGGEFKVFKCREITAKVCSAQCRGVHTGRVRRKNAKPILWSKYWFIKKPEHHRANKQGYVKVADLVAEEMIGRKLKRNEVVHHIDEDKLNDCPENLEVMDAYEHTLMHHKKRHEQNAQSRRDQSQSF